MGYFQHPSKYVEKEPEWLNCQVRASWKYERRADQVDRHQTGRKSKNPPKKKQSSIFGKRQEKIIRLGHLRIKNRRKIRWSILLETRQDILSRKVIEEERILNLKKTQKIKKNKRGKNNEEREGHLLQADFSNIGKAVKELGQISNVGENFQINGSG